MSDAYERAKGGRLTFKGGVLATRSKDIDKKKKKKKNKEDKSLNDDVESLPEDPNQPSTAGSADIYTIDAAKKMKYDELFPVEAKKFGYDPKAKSKTVEEALDDRVKKKADRYCK
ncbi:OLC1v1013897C1 [Oldenlandia corymbosa var. corymbosa]|uniref:OLC1v1013897C1 n=1 Tax=Oldenlandia corymbosa var. corymbosa TaxID=529605 RepID=A0AAV1E2P9_OLDCO|nr:OLC1v1013897C1 [Oldenlandia corymbosa var. corymbosa]